MVHHPMGSQGSGGGSSAETAGGSNGIASQFDLLPRQNSLYGLTLDEFQHQLGDLGKPLGSMNLDELLKNIWTSDPGQSAGMDAENATLGNQNTLQRQASLSLAGELSKKTVDEVWKEIQSSKSKGGKKTKDRQPTLGEMTLEDFLVKTGIFVGSSSDKMTADVMSSSIVNQISRQGQWMPYSQPQYPHPQHSMSMMPVYMPAQTLQQPMQMGADPMLDLPFADNHLAVPSHMTGGLSDTQVGGRKRGIPNDIVDKSIERKQKRMIKNRESAARSRARKQAYTSELEKKVSCLEEENERMRKRKELEKMLPHALAPGPKYQLRRTSSAPY
ncbi:hypothetical protein MLD38_009869 [Melastoma candidum]|uniref:Uncharacterized protein n=1 Tax=Melastoma candidum TaxID=119954 RepID=A0ACB9RYL2_9MYRT|nr:hypothetical protein MLD38_009869 [Melastoma candidum]